MKHFVLAAFTLTAMALPAVAHAQDAPAVPAVERGHTLLTVSGEGEAMRKPDLAVFTAGVSSTGKTAGEALRANSADMNRVIAALKNAGIADRDIQTSTISLSPVYADMSRQPANPLEQQMPRILGYQVSNSVVVKQRKLDEFGKVIDTLVSAGANQVNGPSFQIDKPSAAMDEARAEAMKAARGRANLYANAAGLKVLRILSISESGGYAPRPMVYAKMAVANMAEAAPVEAGELSLSASVTVQFELAP